MQPYVRMCYFYVSILFVSSDAIFPLERHGTEALEGPDANIYEKRKVQPPVCVAELFSDNISLETPCFCRINEGNVGVEIVPESAYSA